MRLLGEILSGVQWGLLAWGLSGGVASFFSPCALPMLPAYLSFYLSTESASAAPDGGTAVGSQAKRTRGASLQRGVLFGSMASLGLLSVFVLTALLAGVLGEVLTQIIPMLIPVTGVVLIILGGLMLADRAGWLSRSVSLPDWRDPSPTQFYLFGVLFAVAALGCTAPVFFGITLTALSTGGLIEGVTVVVGYAGGMIGLFVLMTVLVALAKDETARRINQFIPYIERARYYLSGPVATCCITMRRYRRCSACVSRHQ